MGDDKKMCKVRTFGPRVEVEFEDFIVRLDRRSAQLLGRSLLRLTRHLARREEWAMERLARRLKEGDQ